MLNWNMVLSHYLTVHAACRMLWQNRIIFHLFSLHEPPMLPLSLSEMCGHLCVLTAPVLSDYDTWKC